MEPLIQWITPDMLDLAVQFFLNRVVPGWRGYFASSLVAVVDLCELNPDPPPEFDVSLLYSSFTPSALGPYPPLNGLMVWIYQWVQYQMFLNSCACNAPVTTPGFNCTNAPPSMTTGAFGSIIGEFPVSIDQDVMAAIRTHPSGDWTWFRSGSGTISGGAADPADIRIEIQLLDSSWLFVDTLASLQLSGGACLNKDTAAATTRFGATTRVRLINNGASGQTIGNFVFCFCAPPATAPPQPPFTPPTGVPDPPAPLCSTDDLCFMVTELNRRLNVIAGQISDIQASVSGADVLRELTRVTLIPEGEVELVQGTRAVSVELTALGTDAFTSALGRPRGLMRVGSVRWGDGIGYSPRRFIDADRFDDVRPAGATTLSWQLLPGTQGILKFLG